MKYSNGKGNLLDRVSFKGKIIFKSCGVKVIAA